MRSAFAIKLAMVFEMLYTIANESDFSLNPVLPPLLEN